MNEDLKSWDDGAMSYLAMATDTADPFKQLVDTPSFISLLGDLKGKTVLDIGCGDGLFCTELMSRGAKVIGLDGSKNMLSMAKSNCPTAEFIRCDLINENIPLKQKVAIVTSKMMLMNVASVKLTSEKVWQVLKVGGLYGVDIVHPFRPLIKNLINKKSKYQSGFSYFQETRGTINFSGKDFAFYYRPLQTYINDIIGAGFSLIKIQEPFVPEDLLKKFPDLADKQKYPTSLHLLFRK